MKNTMSLMLVFIFLLSLVGCAKKQAMEDSPASDTQPTELQAVETEQPTQQATEESKPTEAVTEPAEPDSYEEYISTVPEGEYRYADLDGDGEQELIIYRETSRSEIITMSDGELVVIMSENHLFFCEENIIGRFSEGSGGCTLFFYRLEDQGAVIMDVLVQKSQDGTFYRGTDANTQNMTRISKADAVAMSKQYALLHDSVPWFLTWFYTE